MTQSITAQQIDQLLERLESRFRSNKYLEENIEWINISERLQKNTLLLHTLYKMEESGGEPDCILFDKQKNAFLFCDTATESPIGRRSFCYDTEALSKRKNNKPKDSAIAYAKALGIHILDEEKYKWLQSKKKVDLKTSSWLLTPENIRSLGGAIFGDCRYDNVFIYHNGADSYYASRGFRGYLWV